MPDVTGPDVTVSLAPLAGMIGLRGDLADERLRAARRLLGPRLATSAGPAMPLSPTAMRPCSA